MTTSVHLKQRVKEFARPVIITILAAVAFTALLGFHHAKFEDSMIRAFQKQQLDATRSWVDAIEKQAEGIRGDLALLASHPNVCRLAPAMKETLAAYLARENAVLDDLQVLDASGATLWSGRPTAGDEFRNVAGQTTASIMRGKINHLFRVCLPIEFDGKQVGTLQADVNVFGVALRCQPKADSACKSLCVLLSGSGEVIYGNDIFSNPRQVIHALRDADAPKEAVRNMELLPYVVDRCITANSSGLAESIRQENKVVELLAFAPINVEGRRFGLVMGSPRGDVSVPIASHERVTYALIAALALLYFVTGYTALRGERTHTQHEEQRRQAAEEASKAKGNYLAKMSHELRTPMNGIISMTELAAGAENVAERQKYLGVVRECADSLLSVINDILDMSKIEAGRLKLGYEPFNVQACVANTLTSLAPLANEKGLSLRWEMDSGMPAVVFGDPGRLRQILNNLIGNAIKFTTSGEVVARVASQAVKPDMAMLRFDISDTGPGMSPNDLEGIFNPYHQCSDTEVYRKNSTGLGLPIAKQLVELMGGQISVRSEVHHGTVFTFTANFDSAAGGNPEAAGELLPSLENVRALVISGVPANLRRFSGLVGGWAFQVDCVADAKDGMLAVKKAQDRGAQFGLILFDSSAPAMDAYTFAEGVTAQCGCEKTALAVICPNGLRGNAARCPPYNIDAYLGISDADDRFHLALRLALQHAEHRKGGAPITKHSPLGAAGIRILLVEDNPVNQQGASLLLSQWGHNVDIAGSGEAAVAVLAGREFDLVLMDLELPGINGIEATAQIRQQENHTARRTHIIGMTAHAMDSDRARCLAAGMDGYISKPFRPDQLRLAVANLSFGAIGGPVGSPLAASDPAPAPHEPVWDFPETLRLADGNQKAVGIIIKSFLNDLRETLRVAQSAALAGDEKSLVRIAHRWKGSLGLLGARRAFSCAVKLEEVCRLGEPEHCWKVSKDCTSNYSCLRKHCPLQNGEHLMLILVADDDPVYRNFLQGLLEQWHFEVVLAANGAEALAILQRPDGPTLAILDWMMPEMDGYEVCRKIRQTKGDAIPYVLLTTSNNRREELLTVVLAGADDYLLKPFEPLDLKLRLRTGIRILNFEQELRPTNAS